MNMPSWSNQDLTPVLPVLVLLVVLWLIGLRQLQLQERSDVDLQTILILATLEGEVPWQLQLDIAHEIEDQLASLGRMERIATAIDDGLVTVKVSFGIDKNGEEALREVRDAVDRVCIGAISKVTSPATVSKVATAGLMQLTYTIGPLRKTSASPSPAKKSWSVRRPAACA